MNTDGVSATTRQLLARYQLRARNNLLKQKEAALWKQHCATVASAKSPERQRKTRPPPTHRRPDTAPRHMPAYCMRSLQEHIRGFYEELGMFRADRVVVRERFEAIPYPVSVCEPQELKPECPVVETSKSSNSRSHIFPRRPPRGYFSPLKKERVIESESLRLTQRGEPVLKTVVVRKYVRKSVETQGDIALTEDQDPWDVSKDLLRDLERYRSELEKSSSRTNRGRLQFDRWSTLEAAAHSIFRGLLDNAARELETIFEELVEELLKQELMG